MGLNFEDIFDLSKQDEVNQNVINIPTPVGGGAETNVQSQPFLTKDQAKKLAVGASDFGIIMAPGGATLEAAGLAPDPFSGGKLPSFGDIVSDAYGDFKSGDIVGGLAGTGEGILQALGVVGDTAQLYAPAAGFAAPIVLAGGTALKFPNATKNLLKGIFQASKNLPQNQTTQQVQNLSTAQQTTNFVGETSNIQEAINNAPVEIQGELQTTADKMLAANNPPDRILNMIQGKVQALGKTRVSKEAPNLNLIPAGTDYNKKFSITTKSPNEILRSETFFDDVVLVRPTHYNAELVAEKILKENPNGLEGSDLYNQIVNSNIKNNKITETEMSDANLSFLKGSDDIFEFHETKNGRFIFNAITGDKINLNDNPNKLTLSSSFISDIDKKLGKINNIQELTLSSNDRKLISQARQEVFRDAEAAGRLGPVSGISSMLNSQNIGDKLLSKSFLPQGNELFRGQQRISGSAGDGKGDEIIDYGFITINNAGKPDQTSFSHGTRLKGLDDERLAHARVSVRILDGKKYLVIEELQSDFSIQALGSKEKPGTGFKDFELEKNLQNTVDTANDNINQLTLNLNPDVSPLTEVKLNHSDDGSIVFKNDATRKEFFGPELEEILKLRDQVIENQFDIYLKLDGDTPFQFSMYPGTQLSEVTKTETKKLLDNFNNEFQFPGVTDDIVKSIIEDGQEIFGGYNYLMDQIIDSNKNYINNTLGMDQNTFKAEMLHFINEIRKSDEIGGNNTQEVYQALITMYPKFKNEKIVFNDFKLIKTSNRNSIDTISSKNNMTKAEQKDFETLQNTLNQIQRTIKKFNNRNNVSNIIGDIERSGIKINTDVIQNNTFNAIADNINSQVDNKILLKTEKAKPSYQPIVKPEQWGKLLIKDILDIAANKKLNGVVFPNVESFKRNPGVTKGYANLLEVFKNTAKEIDKDPDSIKFNTPIGNNKEHTVIEVDTITEPKSKSVYKQGGLVGSLNGINVLDLGES
tara:strand:+ start:131 stop:3073 length:2943 start_codon:yes stop_codon:yes gene_type:complete